MFACEAQPQFPWIEVDIENTRTNSTHNRSPGGSVGGLENLHDRVVSLNLDEAVDEGGDIGTFSLPWMYSQHSTETKARFTTEFFSDVLQPTSLERLLRSVVDGVGLECNGKWLIIENSLTPREPYLAPGCNERPPHVP